MEVCCSELSKLHSYHSFDLIHSQPLRDPKLLLNSGLVRIKQHLMVPVTCHLYKVLETTHRTAHLLCHWMWSNSSYQKSLEYSRIK